MKKKNSSSPIRIINKSGYVFDRVTVEKAHSFVRQHRCEWVDPITLRLLIDSKDEKRMKEEVWAEAGYVCYICEKQMHREHPELTIDHITPKRFGGSLLKQNMACCCKTCNEEKGCRTLYTYTLHMIMQITIVVRWYGVPVSRHVMRRDANVQGMWRQDTHQEKEEAQAERASASGRVESGSYPQSLNIFNQRLLSEAGGLG